MADFKIKAVNCKNCGSGLVVEVNDNITYCSSCGSGFEINNGDLTPIEINFAAPTMSGNGEIVYKPFWFINAHINIIERDSSGNFFNNLFGSGNNSAGELNFYIPAFYCDINSMKNIASQFTLRNPVASPQKYNTKLTGFVYGKSDAKKLAHFIFISFEAEKSDTIKKFKYDMQFRSFSILGIPFFKLQNGRLKDALLGMEV
ncbi:MAG: TFIIB-type zinc ribbon-containing protein [Ignavibacteriaceae bacterium]|jgi:hypothetical protein|nr:MAG: hypothetical protein EDM69_08025 [Chlorobiota bacterium]KXK03870.1 MAG: hypothetical protein UZ04_CHB001001295 [Chlorobi bacterium OLB4]MBV6398234.1 hypothetical protein [Ignavibacteria bacterium]MCC6885852.1 hypothetical protein [Ignavibacteriales bacterium]MCE7953490.1 hypothetical protein [Chlorobi bacterium CHB7]MDL1887426.1 hypothetical protein [Ignavibacteria bacterium CHB1]MEB2330011.1 TFIIB-type zinc ribbon-containing protein [Ignavibacteriaceae bacterium]OQY78751.1 MAG: hypo